MTASPRAEMRMLVGYVLLAPFSGLLMYLTVAIPMSAGVWILNGSPSPFVPVQVAVAVTIFAAPLATIVGAVPGVAWLIRRGRLTLPNLLLSGIFVGNIPIAIMTILMLLEKYRNGTLSTFEWGWRSFLMPWLMGGWFGVWGALFFWFVSIRGTTLDSRTSNLEPRTSN